MLVPPAGALLSELLVVWGGNSSTPAAAFTGSQIPVDRQPVFQISFLPLVSPVASSAQDFGGSQWRVTSVSAYAFAA